jgi:hypothetical protein
LNGEDKSGEEDNKKDQNMKFFTKDILYQAKEVCQAVPTEG